MVDIYQDGPVLSGRTGPNVGKRYEPGQAPASGRASGPGQACGSAQSPSAPSRAQAAACLVRKSLVVSRTTCRYVA